MDILINDLQKIFGKTPINLNSRAISFVSNKTRKTLIITGSVLLLAAVGLYCYKLGKKSSEHELTLAKKKLKEQYALKNTPINSVSKGSDEFQDLRKIVTVSEPKKDFINKKDEKEVV